MSEKKRSLFPGSGAVWYRRPDFWFILLAAAGLLFRLEYLREFAAFDHFAYAIGPDVSDYYTRAQGILDGRLFPDVPDIHAPLYSFFLAGVLNLTGNSIAAVRTIQLILNWGAWLALTLLLVKQQVKPRLWISFLALAMFTPVLIFHQAELISESLLLPLTAGMFWLLHLAQKKNCPRLTTAAGVICGFMVLAHGLMLTFAAAKTGWLLWQKHWKRAAAFLLGCAVVILFVICVKSIYYGKTVGVQANSAFNVWLGSNPAATGGCYLRPGRDWSSEHTSAENEAKEKNISVNQLYWRRIGNFYLETPAALLKLPLKKLWMLTLPKEFISGADSEAMIYKTPLQRYLRFTAVLIALLALFGAITAFKDKEKDFADFYLLAAALGAGLVLTVVSGRYRMGMMPGIIVLAALGTAKLKYRDLWLLLITGAILFKMLPQVPQTDAEERSIMGEAFYRNGKTDAAKEAFTIAAAQVNDPARFNNFLGIIAEKENDLAEAEKQYRTAIDKAPEHPEGYFNLGQLYFEKFPAQRTGSADLFRQGLKLAPHRGDIWNKMGILAFEAGNIRQAEDCFSNAVQTAPEDPRYRENLEKLRLFQINIKRRPAAK